MSYVSRMLQAVRKAPSRKLTIPCSQTIFGFGNNDSFQDVAECYSDNTGIYQTVDEIPWSDILLRRSRFSNVPAKSFASTKTGIWKRRLLRWLRLLVRDEITFCCLHDVVFCEHGARVLIVQSRHVNQVYSAHLPNFKVIQVSDENYEKRTKPIYDLAKELSDQYVDEKPGLTVFTNTTSIWLLRAYRLLHPERRIILRFHDIIDRQVGGHGIDRESVIAIVNQMREEGLVDEFESYHRTDAEKLHAIYRPNGVNPDFVLANDVPYRDRLYSFVGGSLRTRTRLEGFSIIAEAIKQLYPYTALSCVEQTANLRGGFWIPYSEFAKLYARSEIYVDLYRVCEDEGFSFRIPEALFLNRKIISNRVNLQNEPFYNPDRIFLIGIDPIERLQDFLEKDIKPLPEEILRLYDSRLWWTNNDPTKETLE